MKSRLSPIMQLYAALVVVLACLIAGCGHDQQEKVIQPLEKPVELTLTHSASAIAFRFPDAVQEIPLTQLEKAVSLLPADASDSEVNYRLDLWVDRGVPNVAVAHVRQKNGNLLRQFAQLRNAAIEANIDGEVVWHPKMMPLSERPVAGTKIEDAEPPSTDPVERDAQMRTIARGHFKTLS